MSYPTNNSQSRATLLKLKEELGERKQNLGIKHPLVTETFNCLGVTYLHMMNDHYTAMNMHYEAKHILGTQVQNEQNLTGRHWKLLLEER